MMVQLPQVQRVCLLLAVFGGFSAAEIARMFDLSEAAWYIFLLPLHITPFQPGRRASPDRIREELIDAKKEHSHGKR